MTGDQACRVPHTVPVKVKDAAKESRERAGGARRGVNRGSSFVTHTKRWCYCWRATAGSLREGSTVTGLAYCGALEITAQPILRWAAVPKPP